MNRTIKMIYEHYLEAMDKTVLDEARHFGGITRLLVGKKSESESLLPAFDAALETALSHVLQEQPSSGEVRELAEWMLMQVKENWDKPQLKYSLMAVLRHIIPLICCLSREDASILAEKFETAFPRREQFPIHKELIIKLKERTKK